MTSSKRMVESPLGCGPRWQRHLSTAFLTLNLTSHAEAGPRRLARTKRAHQAWRSCFRDALEQEDGDGQGNGFRTGSRSSSPR